MRFNNRKPACTAACGRLPSVGKKMNERLLSVPIHSITATLETSTQLMVSELFSSQIDAGNCGRVRTRYPGALSERKQLRRNRPGVAGAIFVSGLAFLLLSRILFDYLTSFFGP